MTAPSVVPDRAGWRISDWLRAAGVSRSLLYSLPPERAPRSVKLGRSRIIVESPADWLARVGTPAGGR